LSRRVGRALSLRPCTFSRARVVGSRKGDAQRSCGRSCNVVVLRRRDLVWRASRGHFPRVFNGTGKEGWRAGGGARLELAGRDTATPLRNLQRACMRIMIFHDIFGESNQGYIMNTYMNQSGNRLGRGCSNDAAGFRRLLGVRQQRCFRTPARHPAPLTVENSPFPPQASFGSK